MSRDITARLRGEAPSLSVSRLDAMWADIGVLALDQACATGQVVGLADTWTQPETHELRK